MSLFEEQQKAGCVCYPSGFMRQVAAVVHMHDCPYYLKEERTVNIKFRRFKPLAVQMDGEEELPTLVHTDTYSSKKANSKPVPEDLHKTVLNSYYDAELLKRAREGHWVNAARLFRLNEEKPSLWQRVKRTLRNWYRRLEEHAGAEDDYEGWGDD